MNEKMDSIEKRMRKYQSSLMVSGSGVIALTLWEALKTFVFFTLNAGQVITIIAKETNMNIKLIWVLYSLAVAVFVLLLSGFRFYVGFSANAEARGKKKSKFYLIVATIMIMLLLGSIKNYSRAFFLESAREHTDTTVATFLLDCFSLVALIEMLVSSILVRSCRKERDRALAETSPAGSGENNNPQGLPAVWAALEQENKSPEISE